jgi:hypothetical protein
MLIGSKLFHDEIEAAADGTDFLFRGGEITPLTKIVIAIKNMTATTRKVTFEGLDYNGEYTSILCTNLKTGATAVETTATTSEVWTASVAGLNGFRCKVATLVDGKISVLAKLIS